MKITIEFDGTDSAAAVAAVIAAMGATTLSVEAKPATPAVPHAGWDTEARVALLRSLLGGGSRHYRLLAAKINALPGPPVRPQTVRYYAKKHGIRPPLSDRRRTYCARAAVRMQETNAFLAANKKPLAA